MRALAMRLAMLCELAVAMNSEPCMTPVPMLAKRGGGGHMVESG